MEQDYLEKKTRRRSKSKTLPSPCARHTKQESEKSLDNSTYVVQRGDTLAGVALRLGVKQSELKRVNRMYGSKTLVTGQVRRKIYSRDLIL